MCDRGWAVIGVLPGFWVLVPGLSRVSEASAPALRSPPAWETSGENKRHCFCTSKPGMWETMSCRDPHFLCCGEVPSALSGAWARSEQGDFVENWDGSPPSDCQARDSSGLMPRDLVLVPISSWLTCSLPWFP